MVFKFAVFGICTSTQKRVNSYHFSKQMGNNCTCLCNDRCPSPTCKELDDEKILQRIREWHLQTLENEKKYDIRNAHVAHVCSQCYKILMATEIKDLGPLLQLPPICGPKWVSVDQYVKELKSALETKSKFCYKQVPTLSTLCMDQIIHPEDRRWASGGWLIYPISSKRPLIETVYCDS